jgi:hypothetical protein
MKAGSTSLSYQPIESYTCSLFVEMPETAFENLNEQNYTDWHYMMEVFSVIEKDIWGIIDGMESHSAGLFILLSKRNKLLGPSLFFTWNYLSSHMPILMIQKIWENLEQVYYTWGFTMCLFLHCQFLYMEKCESQV